MYIYIYHMYTLYIYIRHIHILTTFAQNMVRSRSQPATSPRPTCVPSPYAPSVAVAMSMAHPGTEMEQK